MRAAIDGVRVSAFVVPTDGKESDGTLEWEATTLVLVETNAGPHTGLGWTYADRSCAVLIHEKLARIVEKQDAMDIPRTLAGMTAAIRNDGRPGIASTAMAAVEASLWDLKARILGVSLLDLLGARREAVPVYGSGGFTSYGDERLRDQLAGWVAQGIGRVKMKVGREPERDVSRVRAARDAIGGAKLFVDANGAYTRKQALRLAQEFAAYGVVWFEEPVSSDDLAGLRLMRDNSPPGMDIAAGEYGYDLFYFRRMLDAQAVDVLQADATRCGISGVLRADALCEALAMPLSTHCTPNLHAHVACAAQRVEHVEYFHDHVRIEQMLFDGALQPHDGLLRPDRTRAGLGLQVKRADARRYAA